MLFLSIYNKYARVSHRAIVPIAYDMNPDPDALKVSEKWRQPVNGVSSPIPHLFYLYTNCHSIVFLNCHQLFTSSVQRN